MKLQFLPRTRSLMQLKSKQSYAETDIESSCGKLTPQEFQSQRKRKQIRKTTKKIKRIAKQIFHERIYRFSIKPLRKTMRIYEFKESDMGWSKKFTKQICPQQMDNDVQSDSEIVEYQIQKCKRNLFQQIQRRKQAGLNVSQSN